MTGKIIFFPCIIAAALTALAATAGATCGTADHSAVTPDLSPQCTPGVINPAITQSNIHSTICVSGFTKTERGTNVTEKTKDAVYKKYNVTGRKPGEYEIDHLISLEIGGQDDEFNLWPQSYQKVPGAHQKDDVENALHRAICCDAMTLADAQKAIVSDWLGYYNRLKDGSWVPCPTGSAKRPAPRPRVAKSKILSDPTEKQIEPVNADGPGTDSDAAKGGKIPVQE